MRDKSHRQVAQLRCCLTKTGFVLGMFLALSALALPIFAANTTYQYDALGRVTQANHPDGSVTAYQYDAAGNRTQVAKTSAAPPGLTIIQVTGASNLRTLANNAGYTGTTGVSFQFVVGSAVTATGTSNGGVAIDTGTWPGGVTLSLVVSGKIYGGGGSGGAGSAFGAGSPGTAGGDAIKCQTPISITVNSGGQVKSGGGGGGGGGFSGGTTGGDGGGGGFPNGSGGAGSSGTQHDPAIAGSPGTISGGGAGGAGGPPGGAGGNAGAAGANGQTASGAGGTGGAAGWAIRKNGNAVPVTNSGTITGTVS